MEDNVRGTNIDFGEQSRRYVLIGKYNSGNRNLRLRCSSPI